MFFIFIFYLCLLIELTHVIKRPFSRFSRKYLASESRVIKFTWMLCRVQLDIHEINKIQKLRKYLTSESRVKLAWTMPSAARYSLSKKIAKSWTEEACLLCRTQPKLFIKKSPLLLMWCLKRSRNAPKGVKKSQHESYR